MPQGEAKVIFNSGTVGAGTKYRSYSASRTIQVNGTGSGACTALVKIQGSLDGSNWVDLGKFDMSYTDSDTQGMAIDSPWLFLRVNLSSISGTSANIEVLLGMDA